MIDSVGLIKKIKTTEGKMPIGISQREKTATLTTKQNPAIAKPIPINGIMILLSDSLPIL
jgi:hypothetical protein